MRQPIQGKKKKQSNKPVIITTANKITPRISERTLKKRQEAIDKKYKPSKFASGLNLCGVVVLYILLVLVILIGIGGIVVCAIYFNTSTDTQGWKIGGIVMGIVTFIIGVILILLTIFKQTRNRPWKYKKQKTIENYGEGLPDSEKNDDDNDDFDKDTIDSEDLDDDQESDQFFMRENSPEKSQKVSYANPSSSAVVTGKKRETASSPLPGPLFDPLKTSVNNEMIFCPGCNRTHPASHQCMYSTRVANGFGNVVRQTGPPPAKDSIAIQTEDEEKKKKKKEPHTVIDRSLKYSYTTETQTDVTAKPGPNITESIILRRVPIPTAKVVVQQPTTKVMIVKVPNTAGQLVIQPKATSTDDAEK